MLNPLMLLGFLGLGLPVLIHLINRRRLQPELLATMRFVEGRDVANVFAMRLRDVPQLLMRLLLLALFVLLMVRLTRPADRPSDRAFVVVLDNSLSMQRQAPAGVALFESMREQARSLFDGMRDSDTAALLLVGDRVFANTGLVRDRELLRGAVDAAWPSAGGSRALLPAIRQAVAELQSEPAPDRMVVVFSDWRRELLQGSDTEEELQRYLAGGHVRLVLVGEPLPPADNVTVEQAAFHPRAVHIGGGGKLTARVRNFSEREQVLDVALSVGAGQGDTRQLSLPPGDSAHLDLVERFDMWYDVGVAAAAAGGDPLPADDRFGVPMRMRQQRTLLLVTSPDYQQAGDRVERGYSGADVLGYALNPEAALGLVAGVHTSLRRITPAAFAQATLSSFAAVIFYGVDSLPEARSLQDLRDYVTNGGGLWLIPDTRIAPVAFNATFGDLMAGAQFGVLRQPQVSAFASRGESTVGDPLLLPLLRGEWGSLDEVPVSRYWAVQGLGGARAALATRGGEPLAAVATIGRGRVFVQMFDCDIRSTAFPLGSAFLPMIQTVMVHLAGGDLVPEPDVLRAGATHYMHFPGYREVGGEIVLRGPATYRFPVDREGWVRLEGIYVAGEYEATHSELPTVRTRIVTVNPVMGESDLTPADAEDIARVFGHTRVERIPFETLFEGCTRRAEIGSWILALAAVALVAEALTGAWFARRREVASV